MGLADGGDAAVIVAVAGSGASVAAPNAVFQYADLWSSRTTWGGNDPPVGCGDFEGDRECKTSVVIPKGQVIILDVPAPRLYLLLIQGTLIFDPEATGPLELSAVYIIVHGGTLQIGTEDEPFTQQATITLYGHFGNTELPTFGAKV